MEHKFTDRARTRQILDQLSVGERFMLLFGRGKVAYDPLRVVPIEQPDTSDHTVPPSDGLAENQNQNMITTDIGYAVNALKAGKRVARAGWNGTGMFVFMQVPSEIGADFVPRMTSLPELVKAEFVKRGEPLRYSNQLALVKPDSSINGWAPSAADALAEDWTILPDAE